MSILINSVITVDQPTQFLIRNQKEELTFEHTPDYVGDTVVWTIIKAPFSNNSNYVEKWGISGSDSSTNPTEKLVLNLSGTYKIEIAENRGGITRKYMLAVQCNSLKDVVTSPFPGETIDVNDVDGWGRKVEKSIQSVAQNEGCFSSIGIGVADYNIGDIVVVNDVINTDISGFMYEFELASTTTHTNAQVGVIVEKLENSGDVVYEDGPIYHAIFSGSFRIKNQIHPFLTTNSLVYYNSSSHSLTTNPSLGVYVGMYFYIDVDDIIFIIEQDMVLDYGVSSNVMVQYSGADISERNTLNFTSGTNVSLDIVDDSVNDRCDITINADSGIFIDDGSSIRADGVYDRDFIIGSSQKQDDGDPNHDVRMFFDKTSGSFFAGRNTNTGIDNLGNFCYVLGDNNRVDNDARSSIFVGSSLMIENVGSSIVVGGTNDVQRNNNVAIFGDSLDVYDSYFSLIHGIDIVVEDSSYILTSGRDHGISNVSETIIGGSGNDVEYSTHSIVVGESMEMENVYHSLMMNNNTPIITNGIEYSILVGNGLECETVYDSLVMGTGNVTLSVYDSVIIGENNRCSPVSDSLVMGIDHDLTRAEHSIVMGINHNIIDSMGCVIIGGNHELEGIVGCVVSGGNHDINNCYSSSISGIGHGIDNSSYNIIGGEDNELSVTYRSIVGGDENIANTLYDSIVGGDNNDLINIRSSIVSGSNNNITNLDNSIVNGGGHVIEAPLGVYNGFNNVILGEYHQIISGDIDGNIGNNNLTIGSYGKSLFGGSLNQSTGLGILANKPSNLAQSSTVVLSGTTSSGNTDTNLYVDGNVLKSLVIPEGVIATATIEILGRTDDTVKSFVVYNRYSIAFTHSDILTSSQLYTPGTLSANVITVDIVSNELIINVDTSGVVYTVGSGSPWTYSYSPGETIKYVAKVEMLLLGSVNDSNSFDPIHS